MPRGRFLSDDPRVYASIPVTASKGDVVDWPGGFPDDRWEDAGTAEITKGPDNAEQNQPTSLAPAPASVTDQALAQQLVNAEEPPKPAEPPAADVPPDTQTPADAPAAQ